MKSRLHIRGYVMSSRFCRAVGAERGHLERWQVGLGFRGVIPDILRLVRRVV